MSSVSGISNFIGDYSAEPISAILTCPADKLIKIGSFSIVLKDFGTLDTESYGNNISLSTGISITFLSSEGDETQITDALGGNLFTNGDLLRYTSHISINNFGTGSSYMKAIVNFPEIGIPFKLYPGDSYVVTLNDNFQDLEGHWFQVAGGIMDYNQKNLRFFESETI